MTNPPGYPHPRSLGRRDFLRRAALLGGAAVVGPSWLAACGDDDGTTPAASTTTTALPKTDAAWHSNWPGYIDEESVKLFKKQTGINFRYTEDFNDNNEYFAKVQPDLAAGRNPGPDIITPTYWLTTRFISLGWVEEIPFDLVPNVANLEPSLKDPPWDPDGKYSLPWQSGMTGIAYNIAETGKELKSIDDLFDPAYKRKVGMLTEMRDTLGLVLLSLGKDPNTITFDEANAAFEKIERAKADGQIRQFTGNDYMDDLAAGNFVACIGWSGDISQLALDNPDLRFAIPESGGMRWSDTMVIPLKAKNVANAAAWMNYVYDPVNAARITAYVGYNSPVVGVQEELRKSTDKATAALADSTLVFPDEATLAQLHVFADLDEEEEAKFDERFSKIIGA